jgi:replicative DNA helicase
MTDFRVPPQAVEVEKHTLGAMLLSRDAALEGVELLTGDDFYLVANRDIFTAIKEIALQNGTPDAVVVSEHLKKSGKNGLDKALMDIVAEVVSSASLPEHAAIVRDRAVLRGLASLGASLCDYAYGEGSDGSKGLEMALAGIMGFDDRSRAGGLKDWRDGVREASERWSRIVAGEQAGVLTGLKDYDALIRGFLPSQLHVLGGRPGMGKSALVLQIAKAAGRTAIFSLESLTHELVERVMGQDAGLGQEVFRTADGLRKNKPRIDTEAVAIAGYPIKVNDTTSINVGQIHSQCRKMKARDGLDMVIVDYLQLVQAVGRHERREREIGSISEALKRMANDLNVPVLAVASLSRECERREDKRPMLSDLRESGSLESDAHTVTMVYREYNYKRTIPEEYRDVAELLVLKNKNGPKGIVPMLFEGHRFRFVDLDHHTKDQYRQFIGGGNDRASFMHGVEK